MPRWTDNAASPLMLRLVVLDGRLPTHEATPLLFSLGGGGVGAMLPAPQQPVPKKQPPQVYSSTDPIPVCGYSPGEWPGPLLEGDKTYFPDLLDRQPLLARSDAAL